MDQKNEVKKIVLLLIIGVCDSIRSKTISIDEAEHYIFSPHSMRLLDFDEELKKIIHLGTEFENLARLVPDAMDEAVIDVKRRAEIALCRMPPCDYQAEPWLDNLLS